MTSERLFELHRRTVDAPGFRGITFIEVEAKTIINPVRGSSLPFRWTINPYRGCTHACAYCLRGDTPILLADGRTRPIADVRVGDRVYGTVREGRYRRYVVGEVLAVWSTVTRAYRVRLEDGTEIVASGAHRFLTKRGWKYVAGRDQGPERRPHLTVNDELLGTGRFARPPEHGPEYRRGYLCGMIRGDGSLGRYVYARPHGGGGSRAHRFRLALADLEGLARTRTYLWDLGVAVREGVFQPAVGKRRALMAILASSESAVAGIERVIAWPDVLTDEWGKGFLAGIFDAGGSFHGSVRIANTDPTIIDMTARCLQRFGFAFRTEKRSTENGSTYLRLLGGLRENLRFFHTVDPAIVRKRIIREGMALKSDARLRVVSVEPLGVELPMYDLTTTTGDFIADGVVSHNCFARVTHTYLDMDGGRDFETKIVVKVNAPEVLRAQLASKRWKGEPIAMGTATDPYQRAEGRYRLMRGILEALIDHRNPFSILTKGTLILRDLDLLRRAARVTDVATALSIGTLDEEAWRRSEPGTPHPRARLEAVRALNEAGVPCGVLVAPVLPGITDDPRQLRAVVEAAIEAGATHVSPILLHLRPGVRELFLPWLERHYPDLVPRYEELYRASAYGAPGARRDLARRVRGLVRALGGLPPPQGAAGARWARRAGPHAEPPARTAAAGGRGAQQLTLV